MNEKTNARAQTKYATVREPGHPADGCRYAVLVKTAWRKDRFTCEGRFQDNWYDTAKEARKAAELLPGGMNYFPEAGSQSAPVGPSRHREARCPMRASKRDAAKFIRSAVRAGWSRAVETSRVRSGDTTSAPWLVTVILRAENQWDWSQLIVNFHRGRQGAWIVSFGGVSNLRNTTCNGIGFARRERYRIEESRKAVEYFRA